MMSNAADMSRMVRAVTLPLSISVMSLLCIFSQTEL